jgi:hypothetical protein
MHQYPGKLYHLGASDNCNYAAEEFIRKGYYPVP